MRWSDKPEPHDYPAAVSYLSLITDPSTAEAPSAALAKEKVVFHKAKDILRAARLPVLLVRGTLEGAPLQIADGYHRVCASYHLSEDTSVSAQMVSVLSK